MNSRYASFLIPIILIVTLGLDAMTPLGVAVWVGHVIAVLITLWVAYVSAPYVVAGLGTILLIVGYLFSSPGHISFEWGLFNRVVGIGLLWTTARLVILARQAKIDDATRRLGSIVETSSDAILSLTLNGQILSWNAGAERIFGYTASEMVGRSVERILPEDIRPDHSMWHALLEEEKSVQSYDAVRVGKHGRRIDVSITMSALKDGSGRILGVSKIMRDISERKRAQKRLREAFDELEAKVHERTMELSQANAALRDLSGRLMQVQEEERSQLARDLHDEVGQLLTALKIDLQEVQHGVLGQSLTGSLTDSLELVDRLLSQVRTLALDLRPSILDDLGLIPALRWYAKRQAQRNGWELHLDVDGITGRLPPLMEVACFRIAQEALTNVAKYAKAKSIGLILYRQGREVLLLIRDDGVGFDVELARQRAQGGDTLGLLGMEERMRLAGGTLEISSVRGQGTSVQLCFSLTESDQAQKHGPVEVMTS